MGSSLIGDIQAALPGKATYRTIQYTLQTLRDLELVELHGRGRGAYWSLKGSR